MRADLEEHNKTVEREQTERTEAALASAHGKWKRTSTITLAGSGTAVANRNRCPRDDGPMTATDLLKLLLESQELLNEATRAENQKRLRNRHSSLQQALESCNSAAEDGYLEASDHLRDIGVIIEQAESRGGHARRRR